MDSVRLLTQNLSRDAAFYHGEKTTQKVDSMFKKNKRTTLEAQALKQIKNEIGSGRLRPGDRIVEEDLAKKMGMSRFPIREAIRALEREGLLVSIPFKGAHIRQLDEKDLEELYALRSGLEELAIRILMDRITKEKVERLESIVKAMEQATQEGTVDKLILEDVKFHRTLCQLSGNRRLLEIWMTLENQLRSFIALEEMSYKKENQLAKTHTPILDAIKSADTHLAEKSVREHFMNAMAHIKNISDKRDACRRKTD